MINTFSCIVLYVATHINATIHAIYYLFLKSSILVAISNSILGHCRINSLKLVPLIFYFFVVRTISFQSSLRGESGGHFIYKSISLFYCICFWNIFFLNYWSIRYICDHIDQSVISLTQFYLLSFHIRLYRILWNFMMVSYYLFVHL